MRSEIFYECINYGACTGGLYSTCAEGYMEILCAVCAPGYYNIGSGQCIKCPSDRSSDSTGILIVVVIVAIFLIGLIFSRGYLARKLAQYGPSLFLPTTVQYTQGGWKTLVS